MTDGNAQTFDDFFETTGGNVRRALVAAYGVEVGTEAAADAMLVAWNRWDDIGKMDNPAGYLYRVGQSKARRHHRWFRRRRSLEASAPADDGTDSAELIDLFRALDQLTPVQRSAVMLVRSYGLPYAEAAAVLDISEAALTNHVHRGTKKLRSILEETS